MHHSHRRDMNIHVKINAPAQKLIEKSVEKFTNNRQNLHGKREGQSEGGESGEKTKYSY